MDEIILKAITDYYEILRRRGFFSYSGVMKLLVLCFYRDFVFNDYRALLNAADYHDIEKALNCLFGSDCLIPYPDYLKMGKLHIGEMTEIAQRVKDLENTEVLKSIDDLSSVDTDIKSDVIIMTNEES